MGVLSTAIGLSPYIERVVRDKQQRDDAVKQAAFAQLRQLNSDRRAEMAASLQNQLGMANIEHTNAETMKLREPTPTDFETLDTDQGYVRVPKAGAAGPITGPDGQPLKKRVAPTAQDHIVDPVTGEVTFFDPTHPPAGLKVHPAPKPDAYTFPTEIGPDGKPVVFRANTHTGEITPTDVAGKPTAGGAGGGASAQLQQARLMAAVSEARLADERMRAFEDKLLNGDASVTPLKQSAGTLTASLSDTHSPFGALMQSGSEFFLNKNDPEYAQYLRDAATIGRAEQMMSPRGGNETMVRANALLSRAGTGAMRNTIEASRMARQALFGQAGGVAQTLSPQQNQKLETGIQRIKAGDHGDVNLGTSGAAKPDLATRVIQLKAQGLSKEQARAQLVKEGYDLGGAP